MATAQVPTKRHVPREQRVWLDNISWKTYEFLLRDLVHQPGIRLTYDRGRLEIITVSLGHEGFAYLLGRLIDVLTEEMNLPIKSGRTATLHKEDVQRGLEADNCYWLTHESAMRGKREFDPRTDPPPDLAIEIEVTRNTIDRLAIYAALGVPEVWRYDGQTLRVYQLTKGGKYVERKRSRAFPFLPLAEVVAFLKRSEQRDKTSLVRSFRAWVRAQAAKGGKKSSG